MLYPSQDYGPIGSLKARYRPLGLVAQGQFGKVYCAVHRTTGRLVALKLLDRQRSTTSQFLRELNSLLTLRHPALNQLWAIEQTEAGRCLVLDYSSGGTLRQLLESPVLPRRDLMLGCLLRVLDGLAYAHGQGIIHCDVKPENILVQLTPQGWQACLTDFGIAQYEITAQWDGPRYIPSLERGGSPAYMAPERFAGKACQASDLYSMGIILYEVLLGDRPFHGGPNALRDGHCRASVKFSQPLAPIFQKLLHRALSKSPDLRYPSAQAMARALRQALLETAMPEAGGQPANGEPVKSKEALFTQPRPTAVLPWPESVMVDWPLPEFGQLTGQQIRICLSCSALPFKRQQGTAIAAAPDSGSASTPTSGKWRPQLWAAWGDNLRGTPLHNLASNASPGSPQWHLLEPQSGSASAIQDLALGANQGLALTRTALYRWPLAVEAGTSGLPPRFHCLLSGQNDLQQIVLSPYGNWAVVIVKRIARQTQSRFQPGQPLLLLSLKNGATQHGSEPGPSIRRLELAPSETLSGIQLLDRRHGAALLTASKQEQRLGLFSRRGQWLSTFTLPISIQQWVRGTQAYELWAVELERPQVLLRLTLQPFQVRRIPLTIVPNQICPMPWGCVVASRAGMVQLLNRDGRSLGRLKIPLPHDSKRLWLLPLPPNSLIVGIQRSHSLRLLSLDLRRLDPMPVF